MTTYLLESIVHGINKTFPTVNPFYPTLLDVMSVFPASFRMHSLLLLQQILLVGSIWLILKCGQLIGKPKTGWIAALIMALYFPGYMMAQIAQTEVIYVFWVLLFCYSFLTWFRFNKRKYAILSGCSIGLALTTRTVATGPIIGALIILLFALIGWKWRYHLRDFKSRITNTVIIISCATVFVFSGLLKNHWQHDSFTLARGTGLHLFNRIAAMNETMAECEEKRVIEAMAKYANLDPILQKDAGWKLYGTMLDSMTPDQVDDTFKSLVFKTWKENPIRTIKNTWLTAVNSSRRAQIEWLLLMTGKLNSGEDHDRTIKAAKACWNYDENTQKQCSDAMAAYIPYKRSSKEDNWITNSIVILQKSSDLWRGIVPITLTFLLPFAGWIQRNPLTTLFACSALGQILIASLTESAQYRFWEVCIPFLTVAFVFCISDLVEKFSSKNKKKAATQ